MGSQHKMGNRNGAPSFNDQMVQDFAKTTGMTEMQARQHFTFWLKQHPDGKMNKKDLKAMMSKGLPKFSQDEAEKMENHIFRIYDKNQNGFIDFHEFMTVFMILTGEEPKTVLERVFRIFDVDSNGTITREEMLILVTDMHKMIEDDIENNSDEDMATNAFEEMDTDEDGLVTMEEFMQAVLGQKQFSKFLAVNI